MLHYGDGKLYSKNFNDKIIIPMIYLYHLREKHMKKNEISVVLPLFSQV